MNVDLVSMSLDIGIHFAVVPVMSISYHCKSSLVCVVYGLFAFKGLGWNELVKPGEGLQKFKNSMRMDESPLPSWCPLLAALLDFASGPLMPSWCPL